MKQETVSLKTLNKYHVLIREDDAVTLVCSVKSRSSAYLKAIRLSEGGGVSLIEKYHGLHKHYEVMLFKGGVLKSSTIKHTSLLADV
jgi:hypothetical protein